MSITAGAGGGSGDGGALTIAAGSAAGFTGGGGACSLSAGSGGTLTGAGGALTVSAGNSGATGGGGGDLTLKAGDDVGGAGTGGDVLIQAGNGVAGKGVMDFKLGTDLEMEIRGPGVNINNGLVVGRTYSSLQPISDRIIIDYNNFQLFASGADGTVQFDTNDYFKYDASANKYEWYINSGLEMSLTDTLLLVNGSMQTQAISTNDGMVGGAVDGHGMRAQSSGSVRSAFRIVPQSSNPTSAQLGDIYVHTGGTLRFYDGSVWRTGTVT